ncbi:MAG: hypothetical protein MZW92_18345 [Comamonadaceae bacterium]|nr:hypothetical protein [Comamonadaceae bacterium]
MIGGMLASHHRRRLPRRHRRRLPRRLRRQVAARAHHAADALSRASSRC